MPRPRPRNKQDLLKAGEEYYTKLIEMADWCIYMNGTECY